MQQQIIISRRGKERTIDVRVTSEQARSEERDLVITLDDITDLVSAQRTSAWADVARRIAHEIKNPLTPDPARGRAHPAQIRQGDHHRPRGVRSMHGHHRAAGRRHQAHGGRVLVLRADAEAHDRSTDDLAEMVRQVVFMMRIAHPEIVIDRDPAGTAGAGAVRSAAALAGRPEHRQERHGSDLGRAGRASAGEGAISVVLDGTHPDYFIIAVTDNGKGFPIEGRQRLLEPYMTTREGGTGLGTSDRRQDS